MKNILKSVTAILTLLTCLSTVASEPRIECYFDGGGYDDEFLYADVDSKDGVTSMVYESYRGEEGPYVHQGYNTFEFTTDELILKTTVSFATDLQTAVLVTVYKNGGGIFYIQHFSCKSL